MQISLSIRDQWGKATPFLIFFLSPPRSLTPTVTTLLFLLCSWCCFSLRLWTVKADVWVGKCDVYMCACVVGGVFFFRATRGSHHVGCYCTSYLRICRVPAKGWKWAVGAPMRWGACLHTDLIRGNFFSCSCVPEVDPPPIMEGHIANLIFLVFFPEI